MGSAGTRRSTFRVSAAMTPMGTPSSFTRSTLTLGPQPAKYSWKLPSSKKPENHTPRPGPGSEGMCLVSYGTLLGKKPTSRSGGSVASRTGEQS